MKSKDLKKRIITSIPLIFLLFLSFYYSYILIISLIGIFLISLIEFQGLISKIFKKKDINESLFKLFAIILFAIYLTTFSLLIFAEVIENNSKLNILFLFAICIFSDVGGLIFGKIFKGKKLTKISPNKTISGSIGSFISSLVIIPFFYFLINDIFLIITIIILVSLFCQMGDLFISYLKRKANVKDTGNILPGHGGLLDRIDGMLVAIPLGIIILEFLI
tara:strand:+ start:156 stop:815 length:660 start_codon:yes stop_codon:yes gene_type:complete